MRLMMLPRFRIFGAVGVSGPSGFGASARSHFRVGRIFGSVGVDVIVVASEASRHRRAHGSPPAASKRCVVSRGEARRYRPGQLPEPGGDARAVAPARSDHTSKPGITFITAITTGHRQETHQCGTIRNLFRRVPLSCANQGQCQAEKVSERRPGAHPDPELTRMIWLISDNPGNRDRSCPDTPPKPGLPRSSACGT